MPPIHMPAWPVSTTTISSSGTCFVSSLQIRPRVDGNCVRLQALFGDQPYALAQAPPISIARSLSLRRSVLRKGSTACS